MLSWKMMLFEGQTGVDMSELVMQDKGVSESCLTTFAAHSQAFCLYLQRSA